MLCLGIETSCDETALALVRDGGLVAENLASQVDAHALFGGVVPELASREHLRVLGPLLDDLLRKTGVGLGDIDVIAAARGPGLLGSLLVGLSLAKGLALATGAVLVGVNHLWAHLLVPGLETEIPFPALGLVVSGGHTQTYLMRSPLEFEVLGRTLDDAAGEAFDKAAKVLNLPYPGGCSMDALAQRSEPDKGLFPRPYLDNVNLDFSFSGIKTAMANYVAKHPGLRLETLLDPAGFEGFLRDGRDLSELSRVCASFNWSVADTLRIKVERALAKAGPVKSLILAGGVAANAMIRETMRGVASRNDLPLLVPKPHLCTDNAAMIAHAGEILAKAGLCHGLDLEAVPRGREIPWDYRRTS
ncbi:MAG: tRNA (adenosine(37)-N6)-threonylcarbamoyltransferase complex transferase subunit TsaD [Thermodesulfobacteriota bacterium]|nr:tRNA (adenosine(37)-N6)-threonylcarbamoyltransferase complex transferase subunit TsaD [Thermodesulfobacteriota bacterium]